MFDLGGMLIDLIDWDPRASLPETLYRRRSTSSGTCWDELAPAELRHIEPGLAEESDHMGPKVLGSVLSRRCHEQAVDQRADEHATSKFRRAAVAGAVKLVS